MDGAMGTELIRRGLDLSLPLWSGDINVTHPLEVSQVHEDYLSAGADISQQIHSARLPEPIFMQDIQNVKPNYGRGKACLQL